MTVIGINLPVDYIGNYLLVGMGDSGRKYRSFVSNHTDLVHAKYTGMAWLMAGFSSRVIDLKFGFAADAADAPEIVQRYTDIQEVIAQALTHGVVIAESLQVEPPVVPWPLTEEEFFAFLKKQSDLPPTYQNKIVAALSLRGNTHVKNPKTEGVLCGHIGHQEVDHPPYEPLRRGWGYCSLCVNAKQILHDDHEREIAPERNTWQFRNPDKPLPERYRFLPLWKERVDFILNGRSVSAPPGEISYETIIEMAKARADSTVTYYSQNVRPGSLLPGESILACDGMVFNAYWTGLA